MKSIYLYVSEAIGRDEPTYVEVIQSLWSGYGELVRLHYLNQPNVIVKHVCLPNQFLSNQTNDLNQASQQSQSLHPKGWNTQLSHQRKVHSYQVETTWYQHYSQAHDDRCFIPKGLLCEQHDQEWLIVLEDLSTLDFTEVETSATFAHLDSCLKWLANFHAKHIGSDGEGLWDTGTYWHLDTRPDELAAMNDKPLQQYAAHIDQLLKDTAYPTLVHGDAKLANFCFTKEGSAAAAVDFQYVGRGCAMKDVALFMSSAVDPHDCQAMESEILNLYFGHLQSALLHYQPHLNAADVEAVWKPMFYVAWADFHRFVKGWSPDHWKINGYTERLAESVLAELVLP